MRAVSLFIRNDEMSSQSHFLRIQFHTTENNLHEIKKATLKKFFKIGSFLLFKFIIWSEKDSKLNLNSKIALKDFIEQKNVLKTFFIFQKYLYLRLVLESSLALAVLPKL